MFADEVPAAVKQIAAQVEAIKVVLQYINKHNPTLIKAPTHWQDLGYPMSAELMKARDTLGLD